MKDAKIHLMTGLWEYTFCGLWAKVADLAPAWHQEYWGRWGIRIAWMIWPKCRIPAKKKITCKNCLRILESISSFDKVP